MATAVTDGPRASESFAQTDTSTDQGRALLVPTPTDPHTNPTKNRKTVAHVAAAATTRGGRDFRDTSEKQSVSAAVTIPQSFPFGRMVHASLG